LKIILKSLEIGLKAITTNTVSLNFYSNKDTDIRGGYIAVDSASGTTVIDDAEMKLKAREIVLDATNIKLEGNINGTSTRITSTTTDISSTNTTLSGTSTNITSVNTILSGTSTNITSSLINITGTTTMLKSTNIQVAGKVTSIFPGTTGLILFNGEVTHDTASATPGAPNPLTDPCGYTLIIRSTRTAATTVQFYPADTVVDGFYCYVINQSNFSVALAYTWTNAQFQFKTENRFFGPGITTSGASVVSISAGQGKMVQMCTFTSGTLLANTFTWGYLVSSL
jgi:hypothetical protein